MSQRIPMELKQRSAEGKTNTESRAHLWKRQLEEGKYASVKEMSVKIDIGTRRIQQILRFSTKD